MSEQIIVRQIPDPIECMKTIVSPENGDRKKIRVMSIKINSNKTKRNNPLPG